MSSNQKRRVARLEAGRADECFDVDLGEKVIRVPRSVLWSILDEIDRAAQALPIAVAFGGSKPLT